MMIANTRQLACDLLNLPVEKSLIVVDEEDKEYVIDTIVKRKTHGDNDQEWYYALKIREVEGRIKR